MQTVEFSAWINWHQNLWRITMIIQTAVQKAITRARRLRSTVGSKNNVRSAHRRLNLGAILLIAAVLALALVMGLGR